jgi:ATP-dependent RNA helicase DDX28
MLRNICFALPRLNRFFHCQIRFLQYIPIETPNRIEVGHKQTQFIEKKRITFAKDKIYRDQNTPRKEVLMIKCSKPHMNHFYGQIYKGKLQSHLASAGWTNRRNNGEWFTLLPQRTHPAMSDEKLVKDLTELNLNENLIKVLQDEFKIRKPSDIQMLAIPELRAYASKHKLIAAETGSGKTLSYVIPIVEAIVENKTLKRKFNEPIALCLVANRELAFQLNDVFKKFCTNDANIRVVIDLDETFIKLKESYSEETLDSTLSPSDSQPVDVIITMPNILKKRLSSKRNYLSNIHLKKLVIDEANLLLDDSNSPTLIKALNRLNLNFDLETENSTQLVFVSATIPRDMQKILSNIIDCSKELDQITTKSINRVMLHVPHNFYRIAASKRPQKLLELVQEDLKKKHSTMIFSNFTNTAVFIHKFLNENGFSCELFHSSLADDQRAKVTHNFFSGKSRIISCTDIASRGLDTIDVNHVINFEIPEFIADYVHRAGRVGRLGSQVQQGKVTNLVSRGYEIQTIWNIESCVRLDRDLENLNANIPRILNFTYSPKNQPNRKEKGEEQEQVEQKNILN